MQTAAWKVGGLGEVVGAEPAAARDGEHTPLVGVVAHGREGFPRITWCRPEDAEAAARDMAERPSTVVGGFDSDDAEWYAAGCPSVDVARVLDRERCHLVAAGVPGREAAARIFNPAYAATVARRLAAPELLDDLRPNVANRDKTHCPAGHEYTPENTYRSQGRRRCLTCKRDKARVYQRQVRRRQRHGQLVLATETTNTEVVA